MYLFTFEPGDGKSYRVIFGRLPGRGLVPFYTVFGLAVGSSDPGTWYAFDHEGVSEDIFSQHLGPGMPSHYTYCVGWQLWLALTGQAEDVNAAEILDGWRDGWRDQLPVAALG